MTIPRDQIVQESARDKLLSVLRGQAEECFCDNPNCTPPEALVDAFEAELATASSERDCLAMAVLFASQWTPQAPMSLREGINEILATMPGAEAQQPALGQAEAKLDSVQALAMAWSRPSMSAPTRVAGEHLTRLLANEPDPEGIQQ